VPLLSALGEIDERYCRISSDRTHPISSVGYHLISSVRDHPIS
jgi:hypothetical protein